MNNIPIKKLCRLMGVFLILVLSLFSSCKKNPGSPTISNTEPTEINLNEPSGIVFVGDSNTSHLSSYGLVSRESILTGSESFMTLEPDVCKSYVVCSKYKKEMTVAEAVSVLNPKYVVISLGTDGAMSLDLEGVRLSFSGLIESINKKAPDTVVCLQTVPPVCEGSVDVRFRNVTAANQKISRVNEWIKQLADETGCVFIDSASRLCDSDGSLRAEYNTDHLDGYHLNRNGLSVMLDSVYEALGTKGDNLK